MKTILPTSSAKISNITKLSFLGSMAFAATVPNLFSEEAVSGETVYQIFQKNCFKCHAGSKEKGDYRLDDKEIALKGGESEKSAIVPNKPDESNLVKLISLPHDSDDVMPPEGKGELKKEEIELIKKWIAQGAKMPAVMPKAPEGKKVIPKAITLTPEQTKIRDQAIDALKKAEVYVAPIAMGMNELRVNMAHGINKTQDKDLELLKPLAPYITELNLARSNITNQGVSTIGLLTKLEVLDLSNTAIDDGAISSLSKLASLERLNLHHTKVGDSSIPQLQSIKTLKKLYLWETQVSLDAAKKLHAALPDITINLGNEEVKTQLVKAAALVEAPATIVAAVATTAAEETVDFKKNIWPIIEENCLKCHKAPYTDEKGKLKEPKKGLRFDTPEMIMKGSEDGVVIVAGKPEESKFYTSVALAPDHDDIMPPKGDPLTKEQIELIKKWISSGAKF